MEKKKLERKKKRIWRQQLLQRKKKMKKKSSYVVVWKNRKRFWIKRLMNIVGNKWKRVMLDSAREFFTRDWFGKVHIALSYLLSLFCTLDSTTESTW